MIATKGTVAILNRLKFMEFVDTQPATLSAHKILEKYRAQGGHIDHNFGYPYVAHVTSKKTRLDYTIIYESPRPTIKEKEIFNGILSKRTIAQYSRDRVKYADETDAIEIHLTWTRLAVRSTSLKSYAIEEPIKIDEVF